MKRNHMCRAHAALVGILTLCWFIPIAFAAAEIDGDRLTQAEKEPGNWMTYHGTYKSWHYSPLAQIDAGNVKKLTEVWSHVASRVNRGLQGFPLVVDGVLYYSRETLNKSSSCAYYYLGPAERDWCEADDICTRERL